AMPPSKPKHFKASARRLLGQLAPERVGIVALLAAALSSAMLALPGPWIIGEATNVIAAGYFGTRFADQATLDSARAAGGPGGEMLARLHVVPGHGIDFSSLTRWL